MKKIAFIGVLVLCMMGCDPVSQMDADITNTTSQNLTIIFVSATDRNKTLEIPTNEKVLFQDGFSTTGSVLSPVLTQYDSIYIQTESNEILRVYKENSAGKNIYNIDSFWQQSEPSKRFYQYDYMLTNEDLN
ncbi:hypothetical protein [uncultured Croceitalea sp.]|uniref:hypothetical protein n=1 Tax=uncultured Croceitalea sp. TaxID=1798908 RepID=UPI00374FBAF8